jgi:hypothetical protein
MDDTSSRQRRQSGSRRPRQSLHGRTLSDSAPSSAPKPDAADVTLIDVLARRLKTAYTIERRLLETRRRGHVIPYEPPARHDELDAEGSNLWLNAAKALFSEGYDPATYVLNVFATLNGTNIAPLLPEEIVSKRAEALYAYAQKNERRDIEIAYRNQSHCAIDFIKRRGKGNPTNNTVAEVLTDETLGLSSLFRYCFARHMGNPERFGKIIRIYYPRAVLQYMHSRDAYDAVWGAFIPGLFRQNAEKEYFETLDLSSQPGVTIRVSAEGRDGVLRPAFGRKKSIHEKQSTAKKKATRE